MRLGVALSIGFALLVLRSTLFPALGFASVGPDLVFPLAVFYGARGRFLEGMATVLVLGHLADLMSGGVHGVHVFLYAVGFAVATLASRRIDLEGTFVPCSLVFLLSLVSSFALALLYDLWSLPVPGTIGTTIWESLLTALFAWPLLPVLRALRRVTEREGKLALPS